VLLGRNADAGIADGYVEQGGVFTAVLDTNPHRHLTVFGEFDGVAHHFTATFGLREPPAELPEASPVNLANLQRRSKASGDSAAELVTRHSLRESRGPASARRALNILVAEDNPINQTVARRMLEKAGHRVVVAANGQLAVDALSIEHFDVVFMDVQYTRDGWL
jgi:hypothetical protein